MTPQEIRGFVGQQVELHLSPEAGPNPVVKGRIVGVLDAADGLVVTFEPEDAQPGARVTYHYHYIQAVHQT